MSIEKLKRFKNRMEAGELLAQRLVSYARRDDAIVLALPRGGVPVGFAVAKALEVPLDVLLVRKLGFPGHEEYAMGAIASGGVCILQAEVMSANEISPSVVEAVAQRELREIERREKLYRAGRDALQLRERVVILVDDGLATGSTMQVAVKVVREANPARLIVAVPVAPRDSYENLRTKVDEIICLSMPEPFYAVGQWYENFEQTTDEEVIALLEHAQRDQARRTHALQDRRSE
jgi:putative phosphoribosyl transferase